MIYDKDQEIANAIAYKIQYLQDRIKQLEKENAFLKEKLKEKELDVVDDIIDNILKNSDQI